MTIASKPHEAEEELRLLFEGRFDSSKSSWASREYIGQGVHILNYSSYCSCFFSSYLLTQSLQPLHRICC